MIEEWTKNGTKIRAKATKHVYRCVSVMMNGSVEEAEITATGNANANKTK